VKHTVKKARELVQKLAPEIPNPPLVAATPEGLQARKDWEEKHRPPAGFELDPAYRGYREKAALPLLVITCQDPEKDWTR